MNPQPVVKKSAPTQVSTTYTPGLNSHIPRLPFLYTGFVLALFSLLCGIGAKAQDNNYLQVITPQNVLVNKTVPGNILPYGEPMPAIFSKDPLDEEIFNVHFFEEPLVATGITPTRGENQALVYALAAFSQRKSPDDFTGLLTFLKDYPKTRWRGALLANMGIVYRRTGYYSQALAAWEEAWGLLAKEQLPKVKVLADRVLAELLLIDAWTGKMDKIEAILKDTKDRMLEGPGEERLVTVKEGLWLMKTNPGISFKCGPFALNKLYSLRDSLHRFNEKLLNVQSTTNGFSLAALQTMAQEAGLNYQMAYRQAGAPVIPNAVVHWKLDHYSALLGLENGEYKCEDATTGSIYGKEFWLTPAALDSSASGYFLVPAGLLPKGWRPVTESEASLVFGKGQVPTSSDKGNGKCDPQSPNCDDCQSRTPMAKSNVHTVSVSLHIFDRPVFYTPPRGPAMLFDVDYHQRDSYQPANFTYSNLGVKWTFQWLSYVQDNPNNTAANADVYLMAGGVRTFTTYNTASKTYAPDLSTSDVLARTCANCYELRHPDGSKEIYGKPDGNTASGRKIFLTSVVDAAGNEMKVLYDATLLRIAALQDAIGQVTTFYYELTSDVYKITKITDPFGRSAKFGYDAQGRLTSITDMIGIVSSFHYTGADFIDQMTTPYGKTSFIKTEGPGNNRALETQYPMGEKEKVEFREQAPNIVSSETIVPKGNITVHNDFMEWRNTFFWDKKAMHDAPGDYTKAKLYHWLHGSVATGENGSTTPILESTKMPSENRVWYTYQNQPDAIYAYPNMSSGPVNIGRVLDDGTTQLTRFTYNSIGKVTSSIDPLNRKMSYTYDSSNINLLEIRQTTGTANELLAKFTYNSQRLPLTAQDAAGMITSFTYNAAGQIIKIVNPKKESTSLSYDNSGYLQQITGPSNAVTRFTYDGFGRVQTVTDPEGYTVRTDYDNINRPTLISFPDSTNEQIVYDRLDAVHFKDRLGRWSHTTYDSLDRPNFITDALQRVTQLVWCNCGSLSQIIDPLGRPTIFTRDLQGRVTEKVYPDNKKLVYTYEKSTSRLQTVTDAKGQKTQYTYFADGNLKQLGYTNALVATAPVSFTYDAAYNRVNTMTDGTGVTAYAYYPVQAGVLPGAGRLASVDGPMANDIIRYSYDSLGRTNGRSINGIASSVEFDVLGRLVKEVNALGKFGYNYVNETARLLSVQMPNGQISSFDYAGNKGDQRLKQILNKDGQGNIISKFDYEYNPEGQITRWIQQAGTASPKNLEFKYDAADQLVSVTQQKTSRRPVIEGSIPAYTYLYDAAGNRVSEHVESNITFSDYNNLNQLTAQWGNDSLQQHPRPVAVNGVSRGTNKITYDANGNMVSAGWQQVSYDWDAADRLVKITRANTVTEFVYDGLSRRVAEKLNGVVIKTWLWDGTTLAEERDATGAIVVKRFFGQGEQINGAAYYFTRDHLGSVREMTDSDGTVKARYDYDPYGRRTKLLGSMEADFGFTGHYYHAASGLSLALYRAYDPNLGRWINRDPMGEKGGVNLYGYVENNPVSRIDYYGKSWTSDAWNVFSGFSDVITFGLTDVERDLLGNNNTVDKCSKAYKAGELLGYVVGLYIGVTEIRGAIVAFRASKAAATLTRSQLKSISSYEELIVEHEQKLADYIKDPWKYDNKGVLENAPNDAIREKIIEGRIRKLQNELEGFKNNIEKIINGD